MELGQIPLLLVSIARSLAEVAGWALIGQGLLAILAGKARRQNLIYQIFEIVTSPVIRLVRAVTPRMILDAHIPYVAFFLLFWIWVALGFVKRHICLVQHLAC
jgi:hypothetical protein